MMGTRTIDMLPEWVAEIQEWAAENGNVQQLWLFGSRAKGTSRFHSDVDIAIYLMPPHGRHDWALGNYLVKKPEWTARLEKIVGRHVSLEAVTIGSTPDLEVRSTGICFFDRGSTLPFP